MLKKKVTSIALTGALAVSLLAMPVSAAEVPDEASTETIETDAIEEVSETKEPEDFIEETSEDTGEGASESTVEDIEVMDSEVTDEEYGITLLDESDLIELPSEGGELASGNYYLSGDVTLEHNISIPEEADVTIDLNGYTLKGTGYDSAITNYGTFTLEDSSGNDSGTLTGHTVEKDLISGGGVNNSGIFTMNGGNITGNLAGDAGGGVDNHNQATFTMNGGKISGNSVYADADGGGVFNHGTFIMTGGEISGNSAYNGGGVVNANDGTFIMTGGEISGNSAHNGGGVFNNGTFIMAGLIEINGNTVNITVNNIYLRSGTVITLDGALTEGASVGITTESEPTSGCPVQITEAETSTEYYKDSVQYISSDAGYTVQTNESGHYVEFSNNESDSGKKVLNGVCKASDGKWYYYVDGVVDTSYTGFATNENGSWYMENGVLLRDQNTVIKDDLGALGSKNSWYYVVGSKVQYDFTGLANYSNSSGWWYIKNGKVDRSYNGLAKNKNGWYYLTNGKVDRSYTGFAQNENGSWYVTKGKLTRNDNTVLKDENGAIGKNTTWYYVIGSKVQSDFTGLANYKNASGWWYITNGKVDRSVNTVAKNKNGWYYVVNGKVQKGFTGLANYKNASGWWYITNGRVDRSYNGLAKNVNGWYYLTNGKVNRSYTGLATNSNGTWYVKSGKVQKSFTGTVTINGTRYSVTNGKVSA